MGGMRGKGKTMKKIIDNANTTRNQIIENLIDSIINMFPDSGNMFLKEELLKRGYKILNSTINTMGFTIDCKSNNGDIISIRITNFISKEAKYRIWDTKQNLISDSVIQYIE